MLSYWFRVGKMKFLYCWPPSGKILSHTIEKSNIAPMEKILPTPMDSIQATGQSVVQLLLPTTNLRNIRSSQLNSLAEHRHFFIDGIIVTIVR